MFINHNTIKYSNAKSAFTLIELLVVIIIVGILATLATVALTTVRANARDARRISDLKQISSALELYQADNNSYPTYITGGNALVSPNDANKVYMKKVPSDPSANTSYAYYGSSSRFTLRTTIEKSVENIPVGPVIITNNGNVRQALNADNRYLDADLTFGGFLIGHWALDGNTGATDLSGNNDLTAYGTVTPALGKHGEVGGSYQMDRSSLSRVSKTASSINIDTSSFTMSIWVNPESINQAAWSGGLLIGSSYINGRLISQGRFLTYNNTPSNVIVDWNDNLVPTNSWTQIIITHDVVTKTLSSYFNAVPGPIVVYTGNLVTTDKSISIGERTYDAPDVSDHYQGRLSDARIYNKALNSDEIKALYNATKP